MNTLLNAYGRRCLEAYPRHVRLDTAAAFQKFKKEVLATNSYRAEYYLRDEMPRIFHALQSHLDAKDSIKYLVAELQLCEDKDKWPRILAALLEFYVSVLQNYRTFELYDEDGICYFDFESVLPDGCVLLRRTDDPFQYN